MTQEQINELRKLAQAVPNLGPRFITMENGDGSVNVCEFDNQDNFFPLATVELSYHDNFEAESLALAKFYAAANPAAILALIQQRDELLRIARDAATSLETINCRSFGDDSYLNHPDQMRAYAGSRAGVVRKEIKDAGIKS